MSKKRFQFKLVPVAAFDARRGYRRWPLPGVKTRTPEIGSVATADLWVDKQGGLLTRFTSLGYSSQYKIKAASCDAITPAMKDAVENFLLEMLIEWQAQGVDDDLEGDMIEYGAD